MYHYFLIILCIQIIESCIWSSEQCGCWFNNTHDKSVQRIVGGTESIPHSWPWMVSIRKLTFDRPLGSHICGGVLINEQYILTAAHCFYESFVYEKETIEKYLFILGAHYSTDKHVYSDSVLRLPASIILLHESYQHQGLINDIALVKLKEKVEFKNTHIGAICLPKLSETYPPDDTSTVAIGWGRLTEISNKISPTLQQVQLVVEEGEQCNKVKSDYPNNTQFCAGAIHSGTSADTCQGDSGGPLMTQIPNNLWEIVGLTSYGKGCGRENEYGIYTRVSMYINWIDISINNLENNKTNACYKFDDKDTNSAHQLGQNFFLILILININKYIFYS